MNYLRGAVNAISAPYQYYKDINPSTLTGAIDVIVVKRPKQLVDLPESNDSSKGDNTTDENELVCSPFHVRFGKWQVLRPGDKKVRPQSYYIYDQQLTDLIRSMCSSTGTQFRFR